MKIRIIKVNDKFFPQVFTVESIPQPTETWKAIGDVEYGYSTVDLAEKECERYYDTSFPEVVKEFCIDRLNNTLVTT